MEKEKRKHTKPQRTPLQLACSGLFISFILLCVPVFCFWIVGVLSFTSYSASNTNVADLAQFIVWLVPILGGITAIATAYYTTKVMKLYRLSGVVSLITIMSAAVMIVAYLVAYRLWEFA